MTAQPFPPLPDAASRATLPRRAARLPDWPRLMNVQMAADYVGLGVTCFQDVGPKPKAVGRRRLYDRRDLDRWADALDGQPLDPADAASHSKDVERNFLERRKASKGQG